MEFNEAYYKIKENYEEAYNILKKTTSLFIWKKRRNTSRNRSYGKLPHHIEDYRVAALHRVVLHGSVSCNGFLVP